MDDGLNSLPPTCGPVFLGLAVQHSDHTLLIAAIGNDRAKVLADTKLRCSADGDSVVAVDFCQPVDALRASLSDFLAGNGVLGVELTNAIRIIAESMGQVLESTFCGPKKGAAHA